MPKVITNLITEKIHSIKKHIFFKSIVKKCFYKNKLNKRNKDDYQQYKKT